MSETDPLDPLSLKPTIIKTDRKEPTVIKRVGQEPTIVKIVRQEPTIIKKVRQQPKIIKRVRQEPTILKRDRQQEEETHIPESSLKSKMSKFPNLIITAKRPKLGALLEDISSTVKEELPDTDKNIFIVSGIKVENDESEIRPMNEEIENNIPAIEVLELKHEASNEDFQSNILLSNNENNIKQEHLEIKQELFI